tara:strand:+ start:285 stop:1028 length:744 start_codon:yes stop_codon:yes gene_type:complete
MALTKIIGEGVGNLDELGIGTASPSKPLTVFGGDFSTVLLDTSNSSHGTQILFQANGASNSGADIQMSDAGGLKIRTLAVEPLTLATSASAGSPSNAMVISTAGEITKPLQPAFLVTPSGTQSNIPINGLTQIAFGTEVFDIGSNFASNTFTAPVTGRYLLSIHLYTIQNDSATSHFGTRLITSNRNYENIFDPDASDGDNAFSHAYSVIADMDASDTASVSLNVDNTGSAQTDISVSSFFSGALIC